MAPADVLASLGLVVGHVVKVLRPDEKSSTKQAVKVSTGGGATRCVAVPAGPLPFEEVRSSW